MSGVSPLALLVVAIAMGSLMDATIKHLTMTNHVLVVTLGRYVFGAIFSCGAYFHAGAPRLTAEMWRAHALRAVLIAGTATSFFWSLSVLPFAEAVALSFIYPLLAPFAAAILLGERIRVASLTAAALGFVGVIVASQGAPPASQSPLHALGVASVLTSAFLFSFAMVLLRERAQKDGPLIVSLMSSALPALVVAAPAFAFGTPPRLADLPAFLLLGALAAAFMYLMARAYAGAETQRLAPVHYTELIWASVLGYIIFREQPRTEIYFGAAIIIAACLFAAYQNRGPRLESSAP